MRSILLVLLMALGPLAGASTAHADERALALPPECVYVQLTLPQIGEAPMVTVCRP